MCDSTTLNQFKAVAALPGASTMSAHVICQPERQFPHRCARAAGHGRASRERLSLRFVDTEDEAIAAIGRAVLPSRRLSHVDYRSGERWDMQRVTEAAHDKGVLTVWDMSHSAGAVPVDARRKRHRLRHRLRL